MDRQQPTAAFVENVYALVREIPHGRVTSYGAIARALGRPNASRLVGYAMRHASAASPAIPAHRVVNSKGLLSGKAAFGRADTMQERLEKENVVVRNDKVVDFKRVFWEPLDEL